MKIVLQRVARASVSVKGEVIASINEGLLILFGVEKFDGNEKPSLINASAKAKSFAEIKYFYG